MEHFRNIPPIFHIYSIYQRAICSQCTHLRELFNEFTAQGMLPPRLLEDMLLLTKEELSEYSFLDHGPLAMAAVDPEVLKLDMDHAPPDRWHEGVDMCHDMLDAVRAGIEKRPDLAKVCVSDTMCLGSRKW